MSFYKNPHQKASSDDFARAAVFAEFRFKNAVALDWNGFADRRPDQKPPLPAKEWQIETGDPKWVALDEGAG